MTHRQPLVMRHKELPPEEEGRQEGTTTGQRKGENRHGRLGSLVLVTLLALLLGLAGSLWFPCQADAAPVTAGCEQQPVTSNGIVYYVCLTLAQPCLRVHDPSTFAVRRCLPFHTPIHVFGQWTLPNHVEGGSDLWDSLQGGGLVSDVFVNTGQVNAPSPPIPTCAFVGGPGWMGGSCQMHP